MITELMGVDWGKLTRSVVNTLPGGKQVTAAYMAVKKPIPKPKPKAAVPPTAKSAAELVPPKAAPVKKVVPAKNPKLFIGIVAAGLATLIILGKRR